MASVWPLLSVCFGADERGLELFEKQVRPTLIANCIECHGPDEQEGGLRLDSRQGWVTGGDSGPALIAGQPDESLLIRAIRYKDTSLQMPPDGVLSPATIAAFEEWVRHDAPDPRTISIKVPAEEAQPVKVSWAFQPVRGVQMPPGGGSEWPVTEIDRFVWAEFERHGLRPVRDASRISLARRAYYDLTGLPPSRRQLDEFLADESPGAFGRLVDRLLDADEFGERWGRRWLDVVRFAESSGGGRTLLFPNAWRYRDYVIGAFREDMPYDEFLREQLAGDLIESDNLADRRRRLTATAFLLLGPTNFELQDKDVLEMDIIDEQLDTIGKAMLGMTIGCARCHDHKFDPIPAADYYALAGIFKSTNVVIHDNVSKWHTVELPLTQTELVSAAAHNQQISRLQQQLAGAERPAGSAAAGPDDRDGKPDDLEIKQLKQELAALQRQANQRPVAMAVTDRKEVADIAIAIRGETHNRGPVVARGALSAVDALPFPSIGHGASGRLELAEWITDPQNPLTARVMANRVWHWLIGRGLVRTVDNFGSMGQEPSHPELLDFLAVTFVEGGWSTKKLIRQIMTSRVYRLSADYDADNYAHDPDNRWLWRMHRRRLEAEEIRDSLLFISGQLDRQQGGPNIEAGTQKEYGYRFESRRRSVYLPVFRNTLPEIFEVFDFADPNTQGGRRNVSTIAPQALLLMNHPFVIEQCRIAAERQLARADIGEDRRLAAVYREVLGREPTAREAQLAERFVGSAVADPLRRWTMLYQSLVQSIDFRYLN